MTLSMPYITVMSHWFNNLDGIFNHWCLHCFLNHLFSCRSKKTSKLCVTGICEGNPLVTGGFPSQRASNVENVSIWWCHDVNWILAQLISVGKPIPWDMYYILHKYLQTIWIRYIQITHTGDNTIHITGLILGLHPANERRPYYLTMSLTGWVQT